MGDKTAIEWTDATWNPVTGCDQVSPGCDHCYAKTMAPRLKAMGHPSYQTDGSRKTSGPGFGVALHPNLLDQPLKWKRPRRIFVNSMSDLVHDDVPDLFIEQVFDVMARATQHTFQVLTKRPRRMAEFISRKMEARRDYARKFEDCPTEAMRNSPAAQDARSRALIPHLGRNIWLGVSVENQQWADRRIPLLLQTPAAVSFLSCEPLLGQVDLENLVAGNGARIDCLHGDVKTMNGEVYAACPSVIDWVIVGGESGPGARPMHLDWARTLRDQCARVPFFFKQWGQWCPRDESPSESQIRGLWIYRDGRTTRGVLSDGSDDGEPMFPVGKKAAGRQLDGRTWDEMPAAVS